MPDATGKQWYLVQCKPRQATRALKHLENQGYECLLPLLSIERLHKGQLQKLDEPMFPGYLFIQLDKVEDNWLPIRSTRGVSQIVSFGGQPTPVPNSAITMLMQPPAATPPALSSGDRVLINTPGLQRIEAIFMARDGEERVSLLLTLLQREVTIRLPINRIIKYES
ncbi:transcription/translation regulatory transformer protein RfaH [Pseudomonas sp. PI1]|jgi:transcriptional antiterminator RfaH|uniref:transcription/translation regulatory transformer protein RfaH n=1 Tax=Pseudomonas sp. PI1 TaxID=1582493 RepID=UPI0009E2D201|nr:transcription/translation regulatory transformer protein RfaH [Pseudomonas sp. PI1]KWR72752.1 hypothetical protein RN02_27750 [Pseudomonas sp. PI1]